MYFIIRQFTCFVGNTCNVGFFSQKKCSLDNLTCFLLELVAFFYLKIILILTYTSSFWFLGKHIESISFFEYGMKFFHILHTKCDFCCGAYQNWRYPLSINYKKPEFELLEKSWSTILFWTAMSPPDYILAPIPRTDYRYTMSKIGGLYH